MRMVLALSVLLLAPAAAAADWLITPFVGSTFGGSRTFLLPAPEAGTRKFTFGASAGLLSDTILGAEASVTLTPRFFEGDSIGLVQSSQVTTMTGRVLAAVPQAITGYSLRPYLAGGIGWMHLAATDLIVALPLDSNVLALDVGGGAIGMLSDRTGVRFDLRHYRNLEPDSSAETNSDAPSRISFWLASVGIVFRF
jgi:hypothetical protein